MLLSMIQCAQPGRLTGGPKDTTPPKMNEAKSSPNYQTNFTKQTIELVFDEFLKLDKAFTEVVISPPLEFFPKVKLKGKSVLVEFNEEEVLRPEATYTINFGKAIKDLNEGNVVENLRFIFATGSFIDSLQISGNVTDALTGKAVKDATVMLYDNLADSVVRKERPFYFGRTDDSGKFIIQNLKSDTFKVVAILESYTNYKFDNISESIGFLDTPIIVTDSTKINLDLQLFKEAVAVRLLKADSAAYGKLKLIFNGIPDKAVVTYPDKPTGVITETQKDSIFLWHNSAPSERWPVYVQVDTLIDTIYVTGLNRDNFLKKGHLLPTKKIQSAAIKLNPAKPLQIEFAEPLVRLDTSKIRFAIGDSIKTIVPAVITIDTSTKKNIVINTLWQEDAIYQLEIFPTAITSRRGLINQDTFIQSYEVLPTLDFGDITLTITDIPATSPYLLELYFKNDNLVESFQAANDTLMVKQFLSLPPGQYSLKITEDRNGNGRRDTGNYDRGEQPEKQFVRSIEELRAGWEVDTEISLEKEMAKTKLPKKEGTNKEDTKKK